MDEGFPIPTRVPGIVDETQLAHFAVVQELSGYLERTHPPQSPGILESRDYQAIALFVFKLNGRMLIDISMTDMPAPVVTPTLASPQESASRSFPLSTVIVGAVLLVGLYILAGRKTTSDPSNL